MRSGLEGADEDLTRSLIPQWLFISVARAILRSLVDAEQSTPAMHARVRLELQRNRNAASVFEERLERRRRQVVVGIVGDVLRRVGVLTYDEGIVSISHVQRKRQRPRSLANDFAAAVYREYVRLSSVRPRRYSLSLPKIQLSDILHTERRTGVAKAVAPPTAPSGERRGRQSYAVHRVYFATNREIGDISVAETDRAVEPEAIYYGAADVSIPDDHLIGKLERPRHFLWLEMREDPNRHIAVLSHSILRGEQFVQQVRRQADNRKMALVFVHGYNSMGLDDAIRRTAQIAHDIMFQGPAIAFSWTSQGALTQYAADENEALYAADDLMRLLRELKLGGIEHIYLLAHSMGSRLCVDIAKELYDRNEGPRVACLVLAAPDVDRGVFKRRVPALSYAAESITLYASSGDAAMVASRKLHGGRPRAGDSSEILICSGVDSIDATDVDTDWLGHGYFARDVRLLEDIAGVFNGVAPPRDRLVEVSSGSGRYWKFNIPATVAPNLSAAFL